MTWFGRPIRTDFSVLKETVRAYCASTRANSSLELLRKSRHRTARPNRKNQEKPAQNPQSLKPKSQCLKQLFQSPKLRSPKPPDLQKQEPDRRDPRKRDQRTPKPLTLKRLNPQRSEVVETKPEIISSDSEAKIAQKEQDTVIREQASQESAPLTAKGKTAETESKTATEPSETESPTRKPATKRTRKTTASKSRRGQKATTRKTKPTKEKSKDGESVG